MIKAREKDVYMKLFYDKRKVCDIGRILARNTSVVLNIHKRTIHVRSGELCLR